MSSVRKFIVCMNKLVEYYICMSIVYPRIYCVADFSLNQSVFRRSRSVKNGECQQFEKPSEIQNHLISALQKTPIKKINAL